MEMNKNLFDSYLGFSKDKDSYYGIKIKPKDLFGKEAFSKCSGFISEHFDKGQKSTVLDLSFRQDYFQSIRPVHMVSLYLLGLYFECLFKNPIEQFSTGKNIQSTNSLEFKYTWFLTSLYHDMFSYIENISECKRTNLNVCYFDYFKKTCIKNDPYVSNNSRDKRRLVSNYFDYRLSQGCLDHGIVGGYVLYDKLKIEYETAKIEYNASFDQSEAQKSFVFKGLWWSEELVKHFAVVADAIIEHNMWYACNDDMVAEYDHFKLNELIIKDPSDRKSFEKNPLVFALCLLDTIEPVKKLAGTNADDAEYVLKHVSILPESEDNKVVISWDYEIEHTSGFNAWRNNIIGLRDWMQVETCYFGEKHEIQVLL